MMTQEFFTDAENKVLELAVRRNLYQIIKKFAGIHFREIQRKSALSTGSVSYHLGYLTKHGLIIEEKKENSVRYFPREFETKHKKLMILLRQKSIRAILLLIANTNSCTNTQLASFAKLTPSTVSWHLRKLEQEDMIKSTREGRNIFYSVNIDTTELINLLITYQESFLDKIVDNTIELWKNT